MERNKNQSEIQGGENQSEIQGGENQSEIQGGENQREIQPEESDRGVDQAVPTLQEQQHVFPVFPSELQIIKNLDENKAVMSSAEVVMPDLSIAREFSYCAGGYPQKHQSIRPPSQNVVGSSSAQPKMISDEQLPPKFQTIMDDFEDGLDSLVSQGTKNLDEIIGKEIYNYLSGKESVKKRKIADRANLPDSFIDLALKSGTPLIDIAEGASVGHLAILNKAIVRIDGIHIPNTVLPNAESSLIASSGPDNSLVRVKGKVGNLVFFNSEPMEIFNNHAAARRGLPPLGRSTRAPFSSTRAPFSDSEMDLIYRGGPLLHITDTASVGNLVFANEGPVMVNGLVMPSENHSLPSSGSDHSLLQLRGRVGCVVTYSKGPMSVSPVEGSELHPDN